LDTTPLLVAATYRFDQLSREIEKVKSTHAIQEKKWSKNERKLKEYQEENEKLVDELRKEKERRKLAEERGKVKLAQEAYLSSRLMKENNGK
jgi:hypothetical protein